METTGYSNAIWKISSGSMKQTLCATYPLTACWIGCALSWIIILCSLAYDDEMVLKFAPGSTKADALSFCRSSIHKDDKASASVTRVGTFPLPNPSSESDTDIVINWFHCLNYSPFYWYVYLLPLLISHNVLQNLAVTYSTTGYVPGTRSSHHAAWKRTQWLHPSG